MDDVTMPAPVCEWMHLRCMSCSQEWQGQTHQTRLWTQFHHGPVVVLGMHLRRPGGALVHWRSGKEHPLVHVKALA